MEAAAKSSNIAIRLVALTLCIAPDATEDAVRCVSLPPDFPRFRFKSGSAIATMRRTSLLYRPALRQAPVRCLKSGLEMPSSTSQYFAPTL